MAGVRHHGIRGRIRRDVVRNRASYQQPLRRPLPTQQIVGGGSGGVGDDLPGQHAGDFLPPGVRRQMIDRGRGAVADWRPWRPADARRRGPRPADCGSPPAPAPLRRREPDVRPPPRRWRRRCRNRPHRTPASEQPNRPTAPLSSPASTATTRRPRRPAPAAPAPAPDWWRSGSAPDPCRPDPSRFRAVRVTSAKNRALSRRSGGSSLPTAFCSFPAAAVARGGQRRGGGDVAILAVPRRLLQRRDLGRARFPAPPAEPPACPATPAGPAPRPRACGPTARRANSRSSDCSSSRGSTSASAIRRRQQGFRLGQRLLGPFQRGQRRVGRIAARPRAGPTAPGAATIGTPHRSEAAGPGVAPVARRQFRQGGGDRLGPAFVLLQALAFPRQGLFLADPRRQGGEFVDRVTQPFLVAFGGGDGFARLLQPAQRIPPGPPGLGHG